MFGISRKDKEKKRSTLNSEEMDKILKEAKAGFERTASSTRLSSLALAPAQKTEDLDMKSNPALIPVTQCESDDEDD